ncbi:hypothetical protein [Campylobacter jejuni]|uniref:hypothetical protein n=1 Tax=Campylobacter jejuni TaxID=197 RepID=UPI000F7FBBEF|nr:hypothetical protein [Campylobacter jejuni]RTI82711.1 hypothetical protein C3I10_06360 [Campylobacter jejuni]RTJ67586.1 hypothetical protein C3H55_07645 [Campylobacter jejuni]RTJ71363.1 hypothetical protein C3H60_04210 [Campylobacter jejuni]
MKKLCLALAALVVLNVSAFAGVITIHSSNLIELSAVNIFTKAALNDVKKQMKSQFNTDNLEIYAIESIKKDDPEYYDISFKTRTNMRHEMTTGKIVYYDEFLVVDRKTNWATTWNIKCGHHVHSHSIKLDAGLYCDTGLIQTYKFE